MLNKSTFVINLPSLNNRIMKNWIAKPICTDSVLVETILSEEPTLSLASLLPSHLEHHLKILASSIHFCGKFYNCSALCRILLFSRATLFMNPHNVSHNFIFWLINLILLIISNRLFNNVLSCWNHVVLMWITISWILMKW